MKTKLIKKQLITSTLLLSCFLICNIGLAQIKGVVKNTSGTPIKNALVCHAKNKNTWTKTDKKGAFTLPGNKNTKLRVGALRYETVKSRAIGSSGVITLKKDPLLKTDVYHISFDHLRPGNSYSKKELKNDFAVGSGKGFLDGNKKTNRAFVDYNESVDPGGVSIRATFPKNGVKTAGSGFDTRIPLKNTFKNNDFKSGDLYLSYWVKFAKNFPFDKCGGKLPSLGGSDFNSRDNNWKGRIMWRRGGSIQFYMELPNNKFTPTNDSRFWGKRVKQGSNICEFEYQPYLASPGWHNIELHYKFETAGKNNGLFEGWVDGVNYDMQNASVFNNYKSSNRKNITINAILLSTFFGGSDDKRYWPPSNTHAWFDEFRVSKKRINEYKKYAKKQGRRQSLSNVSTLTQTTLFPNPATSALTVSGLPEDAQQILIYNTHGQLLVSKSIKSQTNALQIDVQNLSSGLYFMKIKNPEGISTNALKLFIRN